jgi:antitoxin component YwqK of YwqJK toxin-antitoxin module
MRFLLFIGCFFSIAAHAQLKDYIIGVKGDTLNGVNKNGKKQGKWVVRHDEVRGEPGFEEEGTFFDDRKEGIWRKFTLMGDRFAEENYRWGFKDGESKYFTINGDLIREESWRAFNPDKVYDTIDVEDVVTPDHYTKTIIKNEGSSLKHGPWKYYDPATGFITKTEFWMLGKLQDANNPLGGSIKKPGADSAAAVKAKPKEVLDFEKKNSGKKKMKVRDGSTF